MTNASKNQKKKFLLHFDPVAGVWILSNRVEDVTFLQFSLINLYLFDIIFQGQDYKLQYFALKEFISLTMIAMNMGKKRYFTYRRNSYSKDEMFLLKFEAYEFELRLIKLSWVDRHQARKNVATSKSYILRKIVQKLKQHF